MKTVDVTEHRHRVGQCPACGDYIWADLIVTTEAGSPRVGADGKCSVHAVARAVGSRIEHLCQPDEGEVPVAGHCESVVVTIDDDGARREVTCCGPAGHAGKHHDGAGVQWQYLRFGSASQTRAADRLVRDERMGGSAG
jgi:hypothetical protein